jgi:indolepyruvate ferredoxin oxidoreductase
LAFPPAARAEPLPSTLDEVVAHRVAHLTDYQGPRLADRYRDLVERVAAREDAITPGERSLGLTVARTYAKLLAYKDEYEVARLLTRPELSDEIARTFADGGRISLNMAPPILGGKSINGRPRKREFGAWILPPLRVLARLRGLRGTIFDPFGRTAERRMERTLIGEYEALVERTCAALSLQNHDAAVRLLGMADEIRGFGPVKDAAVHRYHARIKAGEAEFAVPTASQRANLPAREVA